MTKALLTLAQIALAQPLKARGVNFDPPAFTYVSRLEDNLLPGALTLTALQDFTKGAGRELDWKMRAPHSSSALALNHFYPWRTDPNGLALLAQSDFQSLVFEVECTSGLRGTAPHLDVLLRNSGGVLAIESKCTEYLLPKQASFSSAYNSIRDSRGASKWFQLLTRLSADPHMFRHLDAAQLVKHYLGLRHCYPNQLITLLYLYWEPSNAERYEVFKTHQDELMCFSQLVCDEEAFRFEHRSYRDLWQEWSSTEYRHLTPLRQRYDIALT